MLKRFLLRYNYPQFLFGKQIVRFVKRHVKDCKLIIDCPCGNGEIAGHLSQLNMVNIIGADISEDAIKNAQENFHDQNIRFIAKGIDTVLKTDLNYDVFCIVNSLFLFDEADKILQNLKQSMKPGKSKLIVIIPNTEGQNFQWFQNKFPGQNKFQINKHEIDNYFTSRGFKIEKVKSLAYTHHFNRKDIKLFSLFWSIYLNVLNVLQTLFRIGKPNYYFIALSA